jgi:hypothetical protein
MVPCMHCNVKQSSSLFVVVDATSTPLRVGGLYLLRKGETPEGMPFFVLRLSVFSSLSLSQCFEVCVCGDPTVRESSACQPQSSHLGSAFSKGTELS